MDDTPFLRMENIHKEFPGVVANDHIDLTVNRGEVHGLLGENGAGKSTLMKILYGLYSPDSGDIWLDGDRLELATPQDAIDVGIGMVHQHFKLIPRLTVAENIVLGSREPAATFRGDTQSSTGPLSSLVTNRIVRGITSRFTLGMDIPKQEIQEIADAYGFEIDVNAPLRELDIGQQQRVEILKALYRDVDLLILDEPTAVLTPNEAQRLFETLQKLTENGMAIIFITHKLGEVEAITDRVTILRDGENVDTLVTDETTPDDLARKMVGRDVLFEIDRDPVEVGDPLLEARNVTADDDRGLEALSGIDLTVRAGEIVGVAGVSGNGQKELAETMVGVREPTNGTISVNGTDLTGTSPRDFINHGVSFVPEDRQEDGCAPDLSVMDNAAMKEYTDSRFGDGVLMDYNEVRNYAEKLVEDFDVRGIDDVKETTAGNLSGGNQQKLILARELARQPKLLVANQPTRGVDVGAIEFLREQILDQREEGTGVLLLSEDLDEIFDLSDRIVVIYEGEIVFEARPSETDREQVGLEMNGGLNAELDSEVDGESEPLMGSARSDS